MADLARYLRFAAAAAVALILAWTFIKRREFSFQRFQALARWSVGITILAVLVSDVVESGGNVWNLHFLFHCVVFVAATAVMTMGFRKSRKAARPDGPQATRTPARGQQGRNFYVAGAIGLSIIWVAYEQLRPVMSANLSSAIRGYGWAFMGAAWGVAANPRLVAAGVKRSRLLAFGYALAVFAACAIVTRSSELGRMVSPGVFLLLQVPLLRVTQRTAQA